MKKACVTGADGFIGSHLVAKLVEEGHQVRALVQYSPFGSRGWLDDLPPSILNHVDVVAGDVRDAAQMRRLVQGCQDIYHLAALIAIPYSYQAPESYIHTNVMGTLHVLQAALDAGCDRIMVTSTSEVYGTAQAVPMSEAHPLQAQSPYAASKIAADHLAESFWRSYQLPVTIVRPFNTYGPRQSARAVIPAIIGQLLAGKLTIELGDLRPTRDFVFVQDTAEAFVRLASTAAAIGEKVNVATGADVSIGNVAQTLIAQLAPNAAVIQAPERMRPTTSEVYRLCGDPTHLQQLTGWKPATSLTDGLQKTIDWFQQHAIAGGQLHADRYIL